MPQDNDSDWLDGQKRARRRASISQGIAEAEAGGTQDMDAFLDELDAGDAFDRGLSSAPPPIEKPEEGAAKAAQAEVTKAEPKKV